MSGHRGVQPLDIPPVEGERLSQERHVMASGHHIHALVAAATVCSLAAWPARAQAQSDYDGFGEEVVVLYAHGGAFSPLTHLDEARTVDFKIGYNLGGSAAYQF